MKEIISKVMQQFEKMPPKKRRLMVVAMVAGGVLVLSSIAMMVGNTVTGEKRSRPQSRTVEFYPLTGKDTSKLQGDVMSERLKQLEAELDRVKKGEIIPGQSKPGATNPVYPEGMPAGQGGLPGSAQNPTLGQVVGGDVLPGQVFAPGIVAPPIRKKSESGDKSIAAISPKDDGQPLFPTPLESGKPKKPDVASVKPAPATDVSFDGATGEGKSAKLQIREITEESDKKDKDKNALPPAFSSTTGNIQEQGLFLPSGSIISGVLITGMDAPTANQSRKDPFPALLRVKEEVLLPNRMKMDVRECFIIASGFGDMSSERAHLRAETISCVREDGGVIETALNAYAVGEDGKSGIRGRLVSKTGSLIARSLMAGFMAGIADTLKPARVPQLSLSANTGGNQPATYSGPDPSQVFQQGALGGVNNSMNRIADYYVEMARSLFPIIEIDPGRKVDFVVIRGARLAIQSGSRGNQQARGGNNRRGGNAQMSGGANRMGGGNAMMGGGNNNFGGGY